MLKEILEDISVTEQLDKNVSVSIEEISLKIMNFVEQTHIYHLLTKSYNIHMAIGDFYEDIQEDSDSLVEAYIGVNGGFNKSGNLTVKFNLSFEIDNFRKELEEFRSLIVKGLELTDNNELTYLNGVFADIQGDIDSLQYKLSFNRV